jgi:multiple sugar transport system ATP-binding protein
MHYKKLQPYLGKEIIIGIRPEDLLVSTEKSSAENISVQIEVVEPMGNETLLYFTLQDTQMIARGNQNQSYKTGSVYLMHFNKSNIHFFDKESSIAI